MDTKKNRIFDGKLPMEIVEHYPKSIKPTDLNYLKCKIRCYNMDDVHNVNYLFNGYDKYSQKKTKDNTESTDHVIEYNFNVMDFTNMGSSDIDAFHIVYITFMDNLAHIKGKFVKQFKNVTWKLQKNALSIQVNKPVIERGVWITEPDLKIKYPIAVLSFNRANDRDGLTHKLLTKMRIKHYMFIEPQHEEMYKQWYNQEYCKLVICPRNFSEDKMGSCRVRTYICEYFNLIYFDRVWMLDDNIKHYGRFQSGVKNRIEGPGIFTSVEEYIKQYDNVGLVSHNFWPFITEGQGRACIVKNGKCFSSILCPTDAVWKYKYEEDTLLSIEYIQQGKCNLCFNHIVYDKPTSGVSKGGNQDNLYNNGGYKTKLDYLQCMLKIMNIEGRLDLIEGKETSDLCGCQSLKSKKYHHKMDYKVLKGRTNKLVNKSHEEVHKCECVFMNYEKYEEHQKIIQVEKMINDSLTIKD
jgi:hypothetical protein